MEDRLTRVADPQNRLFDLSDPNQNAAYLDGDRQDRERVGQDPAPQAPPDPGAAGDRVEGRGRRRRRPGSPPGREGQVYVEWAEIYMQDGKPMHAQRPYIGRSNAD
jgi:hypothetical protein